MPNVQDAEKAVQLKDFLAAISRRWWIIVLVALSATVCSYFLVKSQSPVYRSSVLLMSAARLDWGTTMTVQVLLRQQEEELKTLALASKVKERMGLDLSPESIRSKIKTKSYADSITVHLDVEDQDPERARRIALGYGRVFEEEKAAQYAVATPENRVQVAMLEEPQPGTLVRPNTKYTVAAGAILGLILGMALAALLEYLDDTLKTSEDVARHLEVPILGTIPKTSNE
ncbi:MAG: YveK family protein [Sphingomonadaceae bacterium]